MLRLLECVVRDRALKPFQLERVPCGHQVVVVDGLNERLDLVALGLEFLTHSTGYLRRVALDSCNKSVGEGVGFRALVHGLDDDDLVNRQLD